MAATESSNEDAASMDGAVGPTRRAVLAGAGAGALVVLTGCTVYDTSGGSKPPQAASGAANAPLAKAADVPVGGGVVTDKGVVVTQPTAGRFLGFSAVCTHQGCNVSSVEGGLINCPCHGSQFRIADGSVAAGPANKPLPAVAITVNGADIMRA